jgi:hypothetical protein
MRPLLLVLLCLTLLLLSACCPRPLSRVHDVVVHSEEEPALIVEMERQQFDSLVRQFEQLTGKELALPPLMPDESIQLLRKVICTRMTWAECYLIGRCSRPPNRASWGKKVKVCVPD